mgnify:CR=1 FL=1
MPSAAAMRAMPLPRPFSATLCYEELALYHETVPLSMDNWSLHPHEYDALVANLTRTRTRRLSMRQHRRLSALMTICFAVTPRPLCVDDASAGVLRHPRTAPDGTHSAVDAMCVSLEGLEAVATYFASLPHGPWFLPNVMQDFLAQWHPNTTWFRELLEETEQMSTAAWASAADRALAMELATKLRHEACTAPQPIRDALVRDALNSAHVAVSDWGIRSLTVARI